MPGDPTNSDPPGSGPTGSGPGRDSTRPGSERARDYLLAELRAARVSAIEAGADPAVVTADLAERLRLLRHLLAAEEDGSTGDT